MAVNEPRFGSAELTSSRRARGAADNPNFSPTPKGVPTPQTSSPVPPSPPKQNAPRLQQSPFRMFTVRQCYQGLGQHGVVPWCRDWEPTGGQEISRKYSSCVHGTLSLLFHLSAPTAMSTAVDAGPNVLSSSACSAQHKSSTFRLLYHSPPPTPCKCNTTKKDLDPKPQAIRIQNAPHISPSPISGPTTSTLAAALTLPQHESLLYVTLLMIAAASNTLPG